MKILNKVAMALLGLGFSVGTDFVCAAQEYSAGASAYPDLIDSTGTSSTPVSAAVGSVGVGVGTGLLDTGASAIADRGALGASSHLQLAGAGLGMPGFIFSAGGQSTFVFDDLTVSALPSVSNPAVEVPIVLNGNLNGSYITRLVLNNPGSSLGDFAGGGTASIHIQLNIGVIVNGTIGNFVGTIDAANIMDGQGNNTLTYSDFGLLAGSGGAGPIPFGPLVVPLNTPFTLKVTLSTQSSISATIGGTGPELPVFSGEATADYSHTFELGPHFTLPDGYTINSAEAGIVDNLFVSPNSVPEPSTLLMGVSTAALLLLRHFWRRHIRSRISDLPIFKT